MPASTPRCWSSAQGGERLDLRVELACNGLFGRLRQPYATLEPVVLDRCQLARFDPQAWQLFHDFDVLRRLEADHANGLDQSWAGRLLWELNRFCNVWREHDRSSWDEAGAILSALLAHRNGTHTHRLSAIGHAHLDTAWLWPLAESYRKAVRTFSSQASYMDRYPEHRFACSQAQQLDWIRRRNPAACTTASAGWRRRDSWVPVGGSWVEPDCNLPSGESLVRQFLYGQRFFEREFGSRCREFWNPDVFGYNGQLPQIMRGAGITRFLTQKLSWNRFNPPAHHSFNWQGLDGSTVLAHFPPADTYNASAEVAELRRSARDYKDHDRSRAQPAGVRLGRRRRRAHPGDAGDAAAKRRPAGRAAHHDREQRRVLRRRSRPRPATCRRSSGELYFEYHRGTYTTQAAVKRGNREGERALHDAELLSALAARERGAEHPARAARPSCGSCCS